MDAAANHAPQAGVLPRSLRLSCVLYGRGVKRSAASIHEQHHKYGFEST